MSAIAQLNEYKDLTEGWDGFYGAKPNREAIREAVRFAQVAGNLGTQLEPALHANGSVILETADGRGALEFKGDNHVIFAAQDGPVGRVPFDGFVIPQEIRALLAG